MQGRYRNPNEGRGYNANPNYRSFNRNNSGGFNRRPSLPPPLSRKEEVFRKAGRLAAEYLVSQGLLPPSALQPKWQNGRFQDFKGQDRDSPIADTRSLNPPLNRVGNPNSDMGNGRRRYNDEFNDPRNDFRGKRRMGPYGREYGSDGGRENGRWMGRNGEYNDVENEDDFSPEYYRDRRSGFDQLPSRSENTMESGSENLDIVEDTGLKVSSSSVGRDAVCDVDGDFNKTMAVDEVKSDASDDSKKKNVEEQVDIQLCENEGESKSGDDLMKSCGAEEVPTKPQSLSAQESPDMDQGLNSESNIIAEVSSEEPKVTMGEDNLGGSSQNSPTNQAETNIQAPEHTDQKHEANQNSPGLGSPKPTNDEAEKTNKREGLKRQRDSYSEDDFSQMHNVKAKRSSPELELIPVDEEKVAQIDEENAAPIAIEQEKLPGDDSFIPKIELGLDDKMGEGKELLPPSFKICDLNLMHAPEITEIHDDPGPPRNGKELTVDFGLSIGNNSNGADDFSRLSHDNDKVVQVIDLEDDSTADASAADPSKPKDEPIYPNLDSFLNQPEHADLPGIQDGYSLEIPDFLGNDVPRCPSVPSDLNNLQGLHDAEGVPNDDDSIYVSLGEIPTGFLEVWDQPPQEYGKFF